MITDNPTKATKKRAEMNTDTPSSVVVTKSAASTAADSRDRAASSAVAAGVMGRSVVVFLGRGL